MNYAAVQAALKARGYDRLGTSGPNRDGVDDDWGPRSVAETTRFQAATGLPQTGQPDAATLAALALPAPLARATPGVVPAAWMPPARMKGIVVHWTAGAHRASDFDRAHYHLLIEADGRLVRGIPSIADNDARGLTPRYAAHTRLYNGGTIGVSLCCMGGDGVSETPFRAGPFPLTRAQWDALPPVLADLCRVYGIPVSRTSVLSHAEVQPTLGIAQAGKWDITRLPFDPTAGAVPVGDLFRARTAALLGGAR